MDKLDNELKGSQLEAKKDQDVEEFLKTPRKAMQSLNASNAEPRRSSRLSKNRVTLRPQEESHDPNTQPY